NSLSSRWEGIFKYKFKEKFKAFNHPFVYFEVKKDFFNGEKEIEKKFSTMTHDPNIFKGENKVKIPASPIDISDVNYIDSEGIDQKAFNKPKFIERKILEEKNPKITEFEKVAKNKLQKNLNKKFKVGKK